MEYLDKNAFNAAMALTFMKSDLKVQVISDDELRVVEFNNHYPILGKDNIYPEPTDTVDFEVKTVNLEKIGISQKIN